jgi:hypothetical protein
MKKKVYCDSVLPRYFGVFCNFTKILNENWDSFSEFYFIFSIQKTSYV